MRLTATRELSLALQAPQRRVALASIALQGSLLALGAAIVLSPFRARFVLEERPLPRLFPDYTDLLLFWNELLILLALGLWAASLVLNPRRLDFGPLLIRVPVLGVAIAVCLSVPFAESGTLALFNAVTLLAFFALALFVLNEVRSISRLLPAVVAMVAVQAVVAITQLLAQASFGLQDLGELSLDAAVPGTSILWTDDSPALLRAYGMSDHPNILGGVLAAAMLVLLASAARLRDERIGLVAGVFAVGATALFATFSRSAILGLGAGIMGVMLLLALRHDWRTLRFWLVACVLAGIMVLPLAKTYSPYLEARVNPTAQAAGSTEERALSEREALARNTNEIFVDHPLVGVGAGVLPTAMWEAYPDFEYNYAPAHVAILVVAAETGLLGAAAYGLLMLAPWLLLWLRRAHLTPELIGMSGALLALQVISLFDYYTWSLDAGRFWFWLVIALWVVAYRNAEGRPANA